MRVRHVNGAYANSFVISPDFVCVLQLRAQVVHAANCFLRRLHQRGASPLEPPLGTHHRVCNQRGLRQVDSRSGRREAQVVDESKARHCRADRVALGVHHRVMALAHFVDNALRSRLIEVLHRTPVIDVLLHGRQLVLHQVGIFQFRQVARAVKGVLRERPARVLTEPRRALAMDAVLGPGQVRQRRQIKLAQSVLQLKLLLRRHPLSIQCLVQFRHEAASNHVPVGDELLAQLHTPHLVAPSGWESLEHFLTHGAGFVHGFGPRHAGHLAVAAMHNHHVFPESRQREINPLDRLEELTLHALYDFSAFLAAQLAAVDAVNDGLAHCFVVRLVVVTRFAVYLLSLGRQLLESPLEHPTLRLVITI